jgi:hypothetical protein
MEGWKDGRLEPAHFFYVVVLQRLVGDKRTKLLLPFIQNPSVFDRSLDSLYIQGMENPQVNLVQWGFETRWTGTVWREKSQSRTVLNERKIIRREPSV